MIPPKPVSRARRVSFLRHLMLFRRDILSAQPDHLYAARMAEFRTPFFRSVLVNEPDLIDLVLRKRPNDFPKSARVSEGLLPLLGNSVFVTNGDTWRRQRRIIDRSLEGSRVQSFFPAMRAAARHACDRLSAGIVDIEPETSHVAADVIFRAMFSLPIDDDDARQVFDAFRRYQRAQPLLNLAALVPLPRWLPRGHRKEVRKSAETVRRILGRFAAEREEEILDGHAPDDLATRLMTASDPNTGEKLETAEVADQLAILFLAGHETSASAMAWSLFLLAADHEVQDAARKEAEKFIASPKYENLFGLKTLRDVFREALRLYPPVPMMVRETTDTTVFRGRTLPPGCQIVLSPWHVHRSPRHWREPDAFCPDRWRDPSQSEARRTAYLPFSAGPRVCPGAGFAMAEAQVILAHYIANFVFDLPDEAPPVPVAHLTVRSRNGIRLQVSRVA